METKTKVTLKTTGTKQAKAETFVKTWQNSTTPAEVAKTLGVSVNAVEGRAFRYRKLGIPLKKYPRQGKKLDITSLVTIAKTVKA